MQKSRMYTFLILMLFCSTTFSAGECSLSETVLLKAFPGSIIKKNVNLFKNDYNDSVLVNVSLRNKKAFIPFSKTKIIVFDKLVAVISFEIFLYSEKRPIDEILTQKPANTPGNQKLLQLLFFNPTTFSIYGKPDGFPIEAESWLCTGDYCDIVQIINLEKISGGNPACILSFSKSVNSQYIQAFLFQNGSIKSSDKKLFGDLSGETGNTIQVDFFNFKEAQGNITVTKKTTCNGDPEICQNAGYAAGLKEISDTLILFK